MLAAPPATPVPESTWTPPRDDCPHPERWHSTDVDSTEVEVSELVAGFVRALQPDLVVETGTAWGQTAYHVGKALRANGQGHCVTFEPNDDRAEHSRVRVLGLPVEVIKATSFVGIPALPNASVGFAWLDSLLDLRIGELGLLRDKLTPGAVVGMHDTGPHHPIRAHLDRLSGWNRINLPTPRGVSFLQRP